MADTQLTDLPEGTVGETLLGHSFFHLMKNALSPLEGTAFNWTTEHLLLGNLIVNTLGAQLQLKKTTTI